MIDHLEKIRRRFLWGGDEATSKINWVSWEKITLSKEYGGLGISSLRSLNIGLMLKWWWRLKSDNGSLWCRVISGIHYLANKAHDYLSNKCFAGVWNNIAATRRDLQEWNLDFYDVSTRIIGNDNDTKFWLDKWTSDGPLK